LRLSTAHLPPPSILDTFARYRNVESAPAFELQLLDHHTRPAQERPRESKRDRKRREKLEQLREADEMKFSHSLQFNAVPDWSNHYIAYSNLKKQYVSTLFRRVSRAETDARHSAGYTVSRPRSTRSLSTRPTPNRRRC
jgi:hypothetical protein